MINIPTNLIAPLLLDDAEACSLLRPICADTLMEDINRALTLIKSKADHRRVHRVRAILKQVGAIFDCSGTGGSRLPHFNSSTSVAFVLAAAGVATAKFGNRAVTSSYGSFDLLFDIGYPTSLTESDQDSIFSTTNLLFLFAPDYYPCLEQIAPARRKLSHKTVINLVGPLLNPVSPSHRLTGIADADALEAVGRIVHNDHSIRRALLVRAHTGRDEIDTHGRTDFILVDTNTRTSANQFLRGSFLFEDFVPVQKLRPARYDTPAGNRKLFMDIVSGQASQTDAFALVAINAGAGLYAAGLAKNIQEGYCSARQLLLSGSVKKHFDLCRRVYAQFSR